MPSPGVRPSGGPGGDGRSGGQSSPGTCSIASSLSGTRALRSASNAGAEARDDLLGSDYPPSSSSAAAVMAAEEAAMAAAGSGSCGIGLPSMIKDNLVMSAAASAASSGSGKGQVSSWTAATANGNSSSSNSSSRANDGKSSTSNKDVSNGIGDGGQSPRSRAQEEEVVEEEGLFDWVGSSIQSACDTAYDNICFPTNKEESNANNGNAESNGGGAPPPLAAQTQTQEDGLPHSSSSATSSGLLGNYLKSGAKSPVSFATSGSTANDMLPAGEDDSSPVRASKTNRGYRRAQTAPPPTSTSSMDHADSPSARRRGSDTSGGGGGTLQPAASMDSIDSRGRRRSSVKSRVAASLKTSRSRSDNNMAGEGTAPSPPKAASFDAAAAGSRDEQDSLGSGLRLSSLRPPLGPRLGTSWGGKKEGGGTDGGTMSWTMMHDKLIDELFEASRRQYIATHFGGGEGGQKGHHHLHDQPKEKEQKKEHSGWKLGKLLPGGGGGNDAEVVGAKSMKKKRRKRKRPKILRRKKKKEEAAAAAAVTAPKTGAIGASVTSALAAATAIATGGASSAKEESVTSPRPAKGKQSKVSSDPSPATEANTSSSFLPRVGRFSPSKKKSSDNSLPDVHRSVSFAKGTAGPKRSIIRATGEYTGRQNPDPGTFLHPKCRLQKDKGRGEIPGNAICVVSREKALKKLRQKVDVIIEVEQSSTASTKAKLKLKQAVLIARAGADDDMIETRSIISVKMGFLSMKYGILLRWDAETGLVHLIVLRKMCPTGFLAGDNGNAAITTDAAKASNGASARAMPSPAVPQSSGQAKKSPSKRPKKSIKDSSSSKLILGRFVDGANAILHGKGWESDASAVGTEVAHLGAPYLVQRPESFADATLSVTVLRAEDLCAGDSRGSDWVMNPYVRLSIGAQTHRTRALKMTTSPTWNDTCRLAVSNNPRDDDQHLKVEVYDWRLMRRDRILGVVFVPVASIEPQKSSRNGAEPVSTEVTIPVRMMRNKKGPYGYVTLSLVHQNDHLCWLKEELKARGRD